MSQLAMITFLSGNAPVDPGFGVPGGGPSAGQLPSFGGGGGGQAGQLPSLPPPGQAVQLPVFPWDPTVPTHPIAGTPGTPDNSLPGSGGRPTQPIAITPGAKFIVKWLACYGLILVPDNSLPDSETPEPK